MKIFSRTTQKGLDIDRSQKSQGTSEGVQPAGALVPRNSRCAWIIKIDFSIR